MNNMFFGRKLAPKVFALTLALIGLLALHADAFAQSVPDTLQKWNILGTWTADCSSPPNRNLGQRRIYVTRGNEAYFNRDFGDTQDSSKILFASILANGMLEIHIEFRVSSPETRVNILLKSADGRYRVYNNYNRDTLSYSVKDGLQLFGNRQETDWLTRCSNTPS